MTTNAWHAAGAAALIALACATSATAQQTSPASERARQIHERAITIDTHDDIPANFGSDAVNPCQRHGHRPRRHVILGQMCVKGAAFITR